MHIGRRCRLAAAFVGGLATLALADRATAGAFSWTFDAGDLSIAAQSGGQAEMLYLDADSQSVTTFGDTASDANVPDLPDGPGAFLHHPPFLNDGAGGYGVHFTSGFAANGGGSFVNDYTVVMDVYIPQLDWTALFNTHPAHGNDADWYVSPSGELGIGDLGYSGAGEVAAATWHRLGFVHDRTADAVTYYVDGLPVFSAAAGSVDGRFSLYSAADIQPIHFLVNGEGDGSGNYSNELYLASFFISDSVYSADQMRDLGGASAGGVIVPEPATGLLALLGVAVAAIALRRNAG